MCSCLLSRPKKHVGDDVFGELSLSMHELEYFATTQEKSSVIFKQGSQASGAWELEPLGGCGKKKHDICSDCSSKCSAPNSLKEIALCSQGPRVILSFFAILVFLSFFMIATRCDN